MCESMCTSAGQRTSTAVNMKQNRGYCVILVGFSTARTVEQQKKLLCAAHMYF